MKMIFLLLSFLTALHAFALESLPAFKVLRPGALLLTRKAIPLIQTSELQTNTKHYWYFQAGEVVQETTTQASIQEVLISEENPTPFFCVIEIPRQLKKGEVQTTVVSNLEPMKFSWVSEQADNSVEILLEPVAGDSAQHSATKLVCKADGVQTITFEDIKKALGDDYFEFHLP